MSEGEAPQGWSRRVLRAMLPIGIVLLVTWLVAFVVGIFVGDGVSMASAALYLMINLAVIANGLYWRRELRRR